MFGFLTICVLLAGAASEDTVKQNATPAVVQWRKRLAGVDIYLTERDGRQTVLDHDPVRSWIVRLDPASSSSDVSWVSSELQRAGASRALEGHPSEGGLALVVVQASEGQLEDALQEVGGSVRYVEQDAEVHVTEQADPPSWGLDRIDDRSGLDDSYLSSGTNGGSGVHVYVLDTGIRTTHVEFEGRAIPTLESLGSGVVVCDPSDTTCANDGHGHGTHCAGTVGSRAYGVAKAATIHAVQVLSASGSGSWSGILLALDWVAAHGERPAVVSMSLGTSGVYESMRDTLDALVSSGVVVTVSAGNSNSDSCFRSPAFVPSAITVGATDRRDYRSSYSCYGSCVDIFAPGSLITSSWSTSDTASKTISGTSMATPHVAGAAALLLGANPSATPADVLNSLLSAATPDALTDVKDGSPNLLLFTPPADEAETTTAVTTASTTALTTVPSTTTSILGGGGSCRCECVCQCQLGSSSSPATLGAAAAENEGVDGNGGTGEIRQTASVTAFAGGGLAAVAFIGLSSGVGYMVGRRAGLEPEEIQPPRGRDDDCQRSLSQSTIQGTAEDMRLAQ